MLLSRSFLAFIVSLCIASPAGAGWVETQQDGSQTIFSQGKIKDTTPGDPTWNVFDSGSGQLMLVDDDRGVYTVARIEEYCRAIENAAEEAMSQMSPEEKKMVQQLMGGMGTQEKDKKTSTSIQHVGAGEKIANFPTEKYRVLVDGAVREELWLAPSVPVSKEIDSKSLQKHQKEMSACLEKAVPMGVQPGPEESPEYDKLLRKGWIMRSVSYDPTGSQVSTTEVAHLQKRDIPATEFQPPTNYRKVPVEEFMLGDD